MTEQPHYDELRERTEKLDKVVSEKVENALLSHEHVIDEISRSLISRGLLNDSHMQSMSGFVTLRSAQKRFLPFHGHFQF